MNWNEMRREAVTHGYKFLKHGGKHDIYVNDAGTRILLERHWKQEVRPGLMKKLRKDIGF